MPCHNARRPYALHIAPEATPLEVLSELDPDHEAYLSKQTNYPDYLLAARRIAMECERKGKILPGFLWTRILDTMEEKWAENFSVPAQRFILTEFGERRRTASFGDINTLCYHAIPSRYDQVAQTEQKARPYPRLQK